nr:hypothetical protein [Tanacetum cinerariifolium]
MDDMDNLLFQTLKIMFEHHVEDKIWKYQQGSAKVLNWKLFYSCGVYCVTTQNMMYYLLVEKMYPFTKNILHQMWNDVRLQYKDAKSLFAAIQTRFSGNEATKKTQKTLLKQMYENFSVPNSMSFDDLYNNFKIVEQEVKGTTNSSLNLENMAFVSSPSSTNEVNTAYGVNTSNTQANPASTQVNTASTQVSTGNLSDVTVYAFFASQPNVSQLAHEDLVQIHEDDLLKMDLKCQLAILSMRTRRFFQKTGRKITINGNDTSGYDKSKVECFNCHKLGHFARECRQTKNQDSRNWNQDSSRRTINIEDTSSNAMVAIDGAGFDWRFMADDEVPTNMALMDFSDSEIHNDKTCSKTCLKSFETLKSNMII